MLPQPQPPPLAPMPLPPPPPMHTASVPGGREKGRQQLGLLRQRVLQGLSVGEAREDRLVPAPGPNLFHPDLPGRHQNGHLWAIKRSISLPIGSSTAHPVGMPSVGGPLHSGLGMTAGGEGGPVVPLPRLTHLFNTHRGGISAYSSGHKKGDLPVFSLTKLKSGFQRVYLCAGRKLSVGHYQAPPPAPPPPPHHPLHFTSPSPASGHAKALGLL